ncbi:CHAT domain-containing protein [Neolewinella aurantiaca]|uniref:CHAT domain-containing protein n=1 Tax=Neolewinella aurantiaca TaxID=2602767 RepID=A0A5C7FFP2_9BACT|nr:CHAT domain-containing tetratricopeptide repeat protein [Neolewinella aurantiaca]TXF89986.1 CHAT domain-containing protein [Neolewinella aurantiaca]
MKFTLLRPALLGLCLLCTVMLTAQEEWEDPLARTEYDSLLRLAENYPNDSVSRKSYLLHQAGRRAYAGGVYQLAVDATRQALMLRQTDEQVHMDGLLVSAFNIGSYLSTMGNYSEANDYYTMVIDRAPNRKEGVALFQLASNYGAMGRFPAGERAFSAAAKLPPFNDDGYSAAMLKQGAALLQLDKNSQEGARAAIGLLEEAVSLFEEYDDTDAQIMQALYQSGWAYSDVGNYEASIHQLKKAEVIADQLGVEGWERAPILTNLGLTYRRMGQPERALAYYRSALAAEEVEELVPPDKAVATDYDNISTLMLSLGKPDSALHYASKALSWRLPDFKPASALVNPSVGQMTEGHLDLLIYLSDKARAHRAIAERGDTEHYEYALATYRRADELLDRMRQNQLLEDTRTYWRADARKLYEEAIDIAKAAGDPVSMFYFLEKARARLLLDELSATRAEDHLPEDVLERLQAAVASSRRPGSSTAESLRFRSLQDSVFAAFPAYAAARVGSPPPDPAQLGYIIGNRTLIEFFVGKDQTVALVWAADRGLEFIELAPPSAWEEDLRLFRASLLTPGEDFSAQSASNLYQQLVVPLELPANGALTIVPDGDLYLLPFGALLREAPSPGDSYQYWPWLARSYDIHYAFSVQLLDVAKQQRGRGNGRALALAPVAHLTGGDVLPRKLELPATLRTLRHLAGVFPTDTLVNAAANAAAFREKVDDYSLIHLGTHAYLDEGGSFLLHDAVNPRYSAEQLTAHNFSADLVVVGACETGLGEALYGEGVASLGRGFARRGAPGIAMSLWSINDGATADLLNGMYDELAAGKGPSAALSAAGTRYRDEVTNPAFGHPYYWAGLVYYGPDMAIDLGRRAGVRWPWALGVLGLGAVLLFLRRGRQLA